MGPQKMIGIGNLLKSSFQLVRKDYSILLPYLISSFTLVLLSNYLIKQPAEELSGKLSKELVIFYAFGWFISLLAQATTIFLSHSLLKKKTADLAESFVLALKKFFLLSILILFSMSIMVGIGIGISHLLKDYFIYMAIPLFMIVLVFFQLFPVIVMLEKASFLEYFRKFFFLLKNNFNNVLRFFLSLSLASLIFIILIAMVSSAGMIGKELLSPLLQGVNGCILTILSVVFYHEAISTISTNA